MQTQTMKMMYGVIADALKDVGKLGERHPQDYLNFFCLGNRETITDYESKNPPTNPPPAESKQVSEIINRTASMCYRHEMRCLLHLF
jgi:phospholipase D1/2